MDKPENFLIAMLDEQYNPHDLDCTAGRACHGPYKHTQQKNDLRQSRPLCIVGCYKTGGCHYGGNLKDGIPACLTQRAIHGSIDIKENQKKEDAEDKKKDAALRILAKYCEVSLEEFIVKGEIYSGQHHENSNDNLKIGVIKLADASILRAKPPCGHGAEGMAYGIEK